MAVETTKYLQKLVLQTEKIAVLPKGS